ncbi:MAG TPA: hypothetical protein VGD31_18900, partial [Sphingobacteriaceae bacterium]
MQLRFLTLTCLSATLSLCSFAQSNLEIGQFVKQTVRESWADVEPLGQDDQGVYYLMIPYSEVIAGPVAGDRSFYFAHINEKAELVQKKEIVFTIDGRDSDFEFAQEVNGKIMVFTSVEEKKARTVTFFAHELDRKNLSLSAPKKVVQLSFEKLKRDYERAIFKSELSRDKTKMLISYSLINDKNEMLTFGYVVLDGGLKQIAAWDGSLDMSDGIYLFDQFRISDKGEVFLLTRFFDQKKDYTKGTKLKKSNFISSTRSMEYKANYDHRVVKFDNNGSTKIIPLPASKTFYNALDMAIAPDGNV